jgi:outer membrane protein assembly factor BamE (lipoprotein component of BamABCDE complex)
MKKLTFFDQDTWDYLHQVKQNEDILDGTSGVMVPYMTDEELSEYVKTRSGEVKTYKLEVSE